MPLCKPGYPWLAERTRNEGAKRRAAEDIGPSRRRRQPAFRIRPGRGVRGAQSHGFQDPLGAFFFSRLCYLTAVNPATLYEIKIVNPFSYRLMQSGFV